METYYKEDGISIYNCDNLELLAHLDEGSINLIYCDILYNTGKKFDDYNDNLGSPEEAMEWYRPRFLEMKRVLSKNGSIFIHCNWRLDSYIRILMDQIFGSKNFRNRIYRKHSKERGFHKNFDSQVDTILYYVMDNEDFVFNEMYSKKVQIVPLFENGYIESRSEARICNGILIDLGKLNKHWLISSMELKQMESKGEITIIDSMPYRFSKVLPVGNLWAEEEMLDRYERTSIAIAYDTPKPEAILERIIKTCSNEGDTVADFFLGGGTTAVVAKNLGRNGIFCDINPKACEVTVSKLKSTIH